MKQLLDKAKAYSETTSWVVIILFFLLAVFQIVHNISKEPVKIWDESSSAQIAIEMLANENYLITHYDGVPTHKNDTKPPVNVWLKVLSYKIFGINEFAVRFPTILAAIATMLIFIVFGWRYLERKTFVIFTLLILSITPGYMGYHVARHGDPDTLLLFFVSSYILLFFYILNEFPRVKPRYYILLALSVALAGLTKSIAGFAPAIGIAIFAFTQKKFYKMLFSYQFTLSWVSALLLFSSYYFVRELYDPNYIQDSILREIGFVSSYPGEPKHPEFSFYFTYLFQHGFYPFLFGLPLIIVPLLKSKNTVIKKLILYSISGALFFLLGNSLSVTKNEWYIAPVYPYLWLLFGTSLDETFRIVKEKITKTKPVIYTYLFFILIVLTIILYFESYRKIQYDNQLFQRHLYGPEREGYVLQELKDSMPEISDLIIYSGAPPRQMKFYIKKFNYLDSTTVEIKKQFDSSFFSKYVLCSQEDLVEELELNYGFDVIYSTPYGKVYQLRRVLQDSILLTVNAEEDILPVSGNFICRQDSLIEFTAKGLSAGKAFSGQKSLLLSENNQFGFLATLRGYRIKNIRLSVWKSNQEPDLYVVVQIPDLDFYQQGKQVVSTQKDWYKVEELVFLPNNYSGEDIRVYVWYAGEKEVYVDDFEIIIKFEQN